ncbi:MAG: hypothetical protein ACI9VT_001359, partial [Psychroserpens sp.]
LSQFVFTGSITSTINFQWLFVSEFFKQKIQTYLSKKFLLQQMNSDRM